MTDIKDEIFKAYDVRGIYGETITDEISYLFGRGLVQYLGATTVAVGYDMRESSPSLAQSMIRGITDQGANAADLGKISTDSLYFAVGQFGYPAGVMITASHNPPEYNGFKVCRENAIPLSGDQGLKQIRDLMKRGFKDVTHKGRKTERDIREDFSKHVLSFIDADKIKPFKIVIDAGNGMGGKILPPVFEQLPCEVVPMYFELDGTFPNHPANPIEPENIKDLQKKTTETEAFLGAAFDGDADRMFLIDENAKPMGGDIVTAMVARNLLKKEPGATIVYNLICSKTVRETIEKFGGKPIRTKVGHALIKPIMREHDAVFGGEHSGHFYFRNNYFADSGIIALLVILELLSSEAKSLSELVSEIDPYVRSGEINSRVEDIPAKLEELKEHYKDLEIDELDGVTVEGRNFWFNVRPSNTEPLLRLNLEADNEEIMQEKTAEVLELIRS
ncbi:MAG TPA: phosphomannomutase/phosphoglucomutase [candidate division Zixibacteria bacterium]|nr:phosphomannomutase/phosphoglucomutase [candidate division Zixibacteria bacterium]